MDCGDPNRGSRPRSTTPSTPTVNAEKSTTVGAPLTVSTAVPAPSKTPSPLVRAVARAQQNAGLGARIATKATCTEAGLLAEAGLDCLVLGPGLSVGNVHRPNEHTRVPELHRAREIYRDAIRALCCEAA